MLDLLVAAQHAMHHSFIINYIRESDRRTRSALLHSLPMRETYPVSGLYAYFRTYDLENYFYCDRLKIHLYHFVCISVLLVIYRIKFPLLTNRF